MICTHIVTAKVKPGRMDEVMRLSEKARPMIERVGGRNYRTYRVAIGGPYTGVIYSAIDFDDIHAWGSALDQWRTDAEWRQLLKEAWGTDGPATQEGSILMQEDGRYGATDRPSKPGVAVEVAYWNLQPGRLEETRQLTATYSEFLVPLGGHHRVWRQHIAGETTGLYVTSTEFPNMSALGEWQMKFVTDLAVRQFAADWNANPPATRTASMISIRLA